MLTAGSKTFRNYIIQGITAALIFLWVYASASKLIDFDKDRRTMGKGF